MSGSEELATIDVSSALSGVEFTVTDGTFRPVAQGMGRLKTQLPAGIYELSTRAGGRVETLLVSLEPGQVWSRHDISMEVFSAAPLSRSRSALPRHAEAAWIASRQVAETSGPPAGLVVQVRVVDTDRAAAPGALHHGQLRLLDTSFEPVRAWADGWQVDAEAGVATNAHRLPPGGYVLRQVPSSGPSLDQTVWLPEGWQTLMFCPNTAERVLLDDASVHLTRLDRPFEPGDYAAGAAAELAISALRQGLPLASADLPRTLEGRPANPILGIVGAHTLLLAQDPDLAQFYWVVQALLKLLPDHPDVIALANHPVMDRTILPSLHWPPMLAASYEVLLQADRTRPKVIADGSPAERVAGYVVRRSPWLRWEATPTVLAPSSDPDATQETELLSATTAGATRRVQAHVHELAALTGESPEQAALALGDAELARRLDLPIQTVRVVLHELGWTLPVAADPVIVEPDLDEEYRRLLEQELVPAGRSGVDLSDRELGSVDEERARSAAPARWRWMLIAAVVLAVAIGGTAAVVNLAGDGPIVDPTATPTPTATVKGTPTDLRVTIHGDTRARAGRRITPYVQVLNQGRADADATLVITVPAAFELAGPVDGCTADGRRLTCAIAPAAAARTRTNLPLTARRGSGILTAEVRNQAGDPDASDDRASVAITVVGRTSSPSTSPTEPTVGPTPQPTTPLPTTPGTS